MGVLKLTKIALQDVKSGMKLAKDVFLEDGRILLMSGFILKPRFIHKLETFKIPFIFIEDIKYEEPSEHISEEKIYTEAFSTIKNVLNSVREGKDIDSVAVKSTVDDIVAHIINDESVFMQLTGIRDIDTYTFFHSVDVCIYALITGKHLGMEKKELTELGISSILHDIGKCKIPLSILSKPEQLTQEEFQVMKTHTQLGYEIICNTSGLSKTVANVALQHHEKWDGSGYPLGIVSDNIDLHSRIVTISDIYDALTADRVYKKRYMPHVAAEYLLSYSFRKLDPNLTNVFLKNIALYPEGIVVLLNTGEVGTVIDSNLAMTMRPKIRIIARKEGPPIMEPYELDLMKAYDVFIKDILT